LAAAFAPGAIAKDMKGGSVMLTPASDVKWAEAAGMPGVKMAALDGDPGKSASHFMMKFAPGFAAPLHHHSSDHHVVVVAGTLVLTVDGKETKLPPGSFFTFKGKKPHMTKCDAGAECVLVIDSRGKWDVVPEDAKPAEKKK
jgi:quercetin dioxygenase-like cupin family protein